MSKKVFKAAPLPFQGQKRNFVPQFKEALSEFVEAHDVRVVVDLFGGSGLLSHTAKAMYPELEVVYNDFDDFHLRLEHVDVTNGILADLRGILGVLPRNQAVDPLVARKVLGVIKAREIEGLYVDYITLSSSLLFSANYVLNYEELAKQRMYNNVRKSDYFTAGYLDGLEVVKMDYKALFERYCGRGDVLFLLDPPYLSTDVSSYSSVKYWRLRNYLDVLKLLKDDSYVFFTSDKSALVELFDWLEINYMLRNPFSKAKVARYLANTSAGKGYQDIMYWRAVKK